MVLSTDKRPRRPSPLAPQADAPQLRRIVITRNGGNVVTASCWCGKALRLELVNINVFVRAFNEWLDEHARCEPKGQKEKSA